MTFTPVLKDRLFYDQYRYCISFHLVDANALRTNKPLCHNEIDKNIARRESWRVRFGHKAVTQDEIDRLHIACDVLSNTAGTYKKVIYSNHLYVYSNDLALLQSLNDLDFVKYPVLTEAQVILPRDTILLKKSKYNFRTYFKMRGVTKQQIATLNDFFNLNKELINPSPSLKHSLARNTHWLMDYQFADHSDPKLITVINLICPGITRKTLNIMAAK
jgi:hypothetical protein